MKKKIVLLTTALFFIANFAQAQLSMGVQAKLIGYKFSEPTRDYITSFKPGFEFGAFARIGGILNICYFQPEMGFSYIGGNISPENQNEVPYQAAAFTIPLLFGVNVVETSEANFRVYVGLGNTISILDNITVMQDAWSELASVVPPQYQRDSYPYQISGIVGIGFDIMDVTIDLRYGRGFNPTMKIGDDKFYQNTFSLALGYKMIKP